MVVDIIALLVSGAALIFSLLQFIVERSRSRKEATIHAFDDLEDNDGVAYLFSVSRNTIDDLIQRQNAADQRIKEQWRLLNQAMPTIEHFAVGINSGVYDVKTLNKMAGNKIIFTYTACENLIELKRAGDGNENNYKEFEKMVCTLRKIRSKK